MWTNEQRQRYNLLRERQDTDRLTREEQAELAALIQALCDQEAASLAATSERKERDIEAAAASVERLEEQNRQLREYLGERQDFLARVKLLGSGTKGSDAL